MKKNFLFFGLILFLLAIIVIGCRKDDDEDVVPPTQVVKSSLTANVTPLAVDYKGQATITWKSLNLTSLEVNGVKMSTFVVYINGVKQPTIDDGEIFLKDLIVDTDVTINGIGKDGKTYNPVYTIKVAPKPAPTALDTLQSNYWMLSKDSRQFFDGQWHYPNWSESELSRKLYFDPSGKTKRYYPLENRWEWGVPYTIKGDSIFFLASGNRFTIKNLVLTLDDRNGTYLTIYQGYPIN